MSASQRTRTMPQAYVSSALLGAFIFLSGCASTGPALQMPQVRLTGVELTSLSFYGQTFLLGFHVDNPNPFPLPVGSVRYELELTGRRFAKGETRTGFVVQPQSGTDFEISVELDLRQSASGLNTLIESGFERAVAYQLTGSLKLDLPAAKPVSFSESGTVRPRVH